MGTWRGERNVEDNGSDRHGQGNRADEARQRGQADRIQRQANSTAMSQEDIDRLERGEG